jgi:hypothetical protein
MKNIGIITPDYLGIGDKVQFASIPENFYKNYGEKLIDLSNCWVYDHNPYILRDVEPEKTISFWNQPYKLDNYLNRFDYLNSLLNIPKMFCRTPRLYKYEDPSNVIQNKVCLHAQGKSSKHALSKKTIDVIKERYSNYEIYQVGAKSDFDCGVIDGRGSSIWDTVKCIATSSIFIGVNSGPINIANCYPHINKKIIIPINKGSHVISNEELEKSARPLGSENHYFNWVDYGWQYFNDTDIDIGITHSYNKI